MRVAHLKHGFFHRNRGNHHSQGNVQVYNARIPADTLGCLAALLVRFSASVLLLCCLPLLSCGFILLLETGTPFGSNLCRPGAPL